MTRREEQITEFLNGRQLSLLAAILLVLGTLVAAGTGRFASSAPTSGIYFDPASWQDFTAGPVGMAVNLALLVAVSELSVVLNRMFNFVRAVTRVNVTTFLLLLLACPWNTVQLSTGTLLVLLAVAGQFLLYGNYQNAGHSQKSIFLSFAVLSLCCMFQWEAVVLVVAFALGWVQMRCVSLRSLSAMLLGLATPFWIALGLGLVDPISASLPQFQGIWQHPQPGQTDLMVAWAAAVAVVGVLLAAGNTFTILNYRRQTRMCNAFILTLLLTSVAMMVIDYPHFVTYAPLLAWTISVQVAHAFTRHGGRGSRRYVLVLALLVAAVGVWAGHVFL